MGRGMDYVCNISLFLVLSLYRWPLAVVTLYYADTRRGFLEALDFIDDGWRGDWVM